MSTTQSAVEALDRELKNEKKQLEDLDWKKKAKEKERDQAKEKAVQLKAALDRQEQEATRLDGEVIAFDTQINTIRSSQQQKQSQLQQLTEELKKSLEPK